MQDSKTTKYCSVLALYGKGVVRGFAIGQAMVIGGAKVDIAHYRIPEEEIEKECQRLEYACLQVHRELQDILKQLPQDAPKEIAPLLTVHSLLLQDPMLLDETKAIIKERQYNAEWALKTQETLIAEKFSQMSDEYLSERISDIQQVVHRVILFLTNKSSTINPELFDEIRHPILVARDISPADMIRLKDHDFSAFLTALGGATSHTAIVARSMNIPAVVGMGEVQSLISDRDVLIVDGQKGLVIVNPTEEILALYRHKKEAYDLQRRGLMAQKGAAITLDHQPIHLYANIEEPKEVDFAIEMGAEGIGLFRTEFLFMGRSELPSEDEQFEAYRYVLERMGPERSVTIRTLDLGQDKNLDKSVSDDSDANALGMRAIRYCLARPEMFTKQLRALYRASVYGNLRVMFPMISHITEVHAIVALLKEVRVRLQDEGVAFKKFQIGAMVEVPAIALAINSFLKQLDFGSIGTNDLIQYTMAIDRCDSQLASLYDPLHPGVLKLMWQTILAGERFSKPISVCGEMAGDPKYTKLLLGMGLKHFSMHANSFPEVRAIIQQSHTQHIRDIISNPLHDGEFIDLVQLGIA
ncbi:phosphoenolpyruvate--protein phosphotransferase [Basilea psittacipulmonis]|uniref:Phosphoenolpyruvate-protein phosphotransferase n=1 Tax=Basilea psittacipulmonis DSM 24701 TaxID=1072685 RepID=A0A077DH95_9BURK|nr:phosphoenolpyruvate--protein phosphotransferase [Basilea psittacipulmonis]AIL32523.1 phosphoenolpyruvate-protein phosphotransferase [Basilea psittacipulmonis DSM 24701]